MSASRPPSTILVDVWYVELDGAAPALLTRIESMLPSDARARARRIGSIDAQQAFVAAHALARWLQDHADGAGRTTSLTHTAGLAAFATATGGAIGVDAESLRSVGDMSAVARTVVADVERSWFDRAGPAAQRDLFVRLWTLKEAISKALGLGLALDFTTIGLALDPPSVVAVPRGHGSAAEWHLDEHLLPRSHRLAVAVGHAPGDDVVVRWRSATLHQIVEGNLQREAGR